jgi:hypothetical protein
MQNKKEYRECRPTGKTPKRSKRMTKTLGAHNEKPSHICAALAGDPDVMAKSGQILLASELAAEYGFTDIDGKVPPPPSRDPAPLSVFKPNVMT